MTVLSNDSLDRGNKTWTLVIAVLVLAMSVVALSSARPAHAQSVEFKAAQNEWLNTRNKEEVCINYARAAQLGAIAVKRGIKFTDIPFNSTSHPDADALIRKGIEDGFNATLEYLTSHEGRTLPKEETIADQVGEIAYNNCMHDPNMPGKVGEEVDAK